MRKGASWIVRLVIGLVLAALVLIVILPILGVFARSISATPEEQANMSLINLADTVHGLLEEDPLAFICESFEMFLPQAYYLTLSADDHSILVLMKKSDTDCAVSSECVGTTICTGEGAEQVCVEPICRDGKCSRPIRTSKLKDLGSISICCNYELDNLEMCNTYCGSGKLLAIGEGKSVNGKVCVCYKGSTMQVYQPGTNVACVTT